MKEKTHSYFEITALAKSNNA